MLKREEDYIAAIKSLEKELVFLKRELQRSEDACSSLLLQFEIQSESYRDLSSVIVSSLPRCIITLSQFFIFYFYFYLWK